ncbi:MAG: hypothetical protein ACRD1L_13925, partial [Terriglobales bacterium]
MGRAHRESHGGGELDGQIVEIEVMIYRHADLLGSSRLATTPAGGLYSQTAFAPFGEPIAAAGTQDRSFTGKKQDIASGGGGTDANGQYDFPTRRLATFCLGRSRWSLGGRASIPGKGRPLALRASPSCRTGTRPP